ncbi:MAG: hypothetical protein KDA42_01050 [Planctomycetales bacterium]|nr:hypothetical protein [Planctomycetales bacterium]
MATPLTESMPEHDTAPPAEPELVLRPQISRRWALSAEHLLVVIVWGALFLFLSYLPLRATDIWGHVAYGDWILQHRSLPAEDPFLPTAAGVPVVHSAWLSQVVFAATESLGGAEALSALFALCVFAALVILSRAFYLQSHRPLLALASAMIVLGVGWSRIGTIRPEIFSSLAFAVLLWMVVRTRQAGQNAASNTPWWLWIGMAVMFAVWANLHGSFVCGLVVLGCFALGRMSEVFLEQRSLRAALSDREGRRWLYLTELSLLATLVNPHGIDLHLYTLWFSSNENLRDVLEWKPLAFTGVGGREFVLSIAALLIIWRRSRARIPVAHGLLLAFFATLALSGIRMLSWYAPVYALVVTPHLANIARQWFGPRRQIDPQRLPPAPTSNSEETPLQVWKYSLMALLVIWISFALSRVSRPLLGGDPPRQEVLLGEMTPIELTRYFRDHRPNGMIFNPQWFGDWLVWDGPEGIQPFMTTNMHLAPRQVWKDYRHILYARPGWRDVLYRYHIDTVVVDKDVPEGLEDVLRRDPFWKVIHEDSRAAVFVRKVSNEEAGPEAPADDDAGQSVEEQV